MKTLVNIVLIVIALTMGTTVMAQTRNYKDGTVWTVGFIKTSANMGDQYLNTLKNNWIAVQDEAVKEGLILSYKVLYGEAANPDDWNIMLLTEYKNLASMDGIDAKWDAIEKKVIGDEKAMQQLNDSRANVRTIYGGKILREALYK